MLITFSGLDGAGKSTLIEWLRSDLERQRHPVAVLHLNDDVGVYSWLRAIRDRVAGGPPPNALPRMTPLPTRLGRLRDAILWSRLLRIVLYPVDLLAFAVMRFYQERVRRRVLIMDRYFYDRLVDVTGRRGEPWLRVLASLTPTPDLPVLLEISPEEAYARKGEYTVEYLRRRREAYARVFPWVPASLTLSACELPAARLAIAAAVRERLGT